MHESLSPALIAIVDDDPGLRRLMERRLQEAGLRSIGIADGAAAIAWLSENAPDLAVVDYRLPDMDAGEVLAALDARGVRVPFIVATGFGDERVAVDMMKRGARDYLMKDGAFLDLLPEVVAQALAGIERERRLDRAREALRLLESAVRQAKDAIVITTADLDEPGPRIVFVNPAFCEMTGYSEQDVIARTPRLLQGAETDRSTLARIRAELERGQPFFGYLRNHRKSGDSYLAEIRMGPIRDEVGAITHWVAIQRDVTERHRLEEQMQQASKLEAIGSLAGGVAHDFNNMLAVIRIQTDLLLESMERADPRRSDVLAIRKAGDHAADLTRQLLAFSRKQMLTPRVIDLGTVVARAESLLRHLIGDTIEVRTRVSDDTPRIKADPSQMEQVIMNLAVNARDAMPAGGRLSLTVSGVTVSGDADAPVAGMTPGRYAKLEVADTGTGIDSDTLPRIFEPFFTTKDAGKGTGLGLAMVYGIVMQSGGHIGVDSEVGRGSAFAVYMPATAAATEVVEATTVASAEPGNGAVVLYVEDEPLVRKLVGRCLEGGGYRVLSARGGDEALDLFAEHQDAIEVLITDVVMPRIGGVRLAEMLRAIRPDLAVIFVSGYAEDALGDSFEPSETDHFLAKPFTPPELLAIVSRIIARRRRGPRESGLLE